MSEMTEVSMHHITVPRTARYYLAGSIGAVTRDVWIVCHGYGQLAARFLEWFRAGINDSRIVVAPEALSRFYLSMELPHTAKSKVGALWMTREDRDAEIADIVSYLDAVYEEILGRLSEHGIQRDHVRVHALGFSQGAAVVSRWVARGNARVDHLVVSGSGVPDDVNLRAMHERRPELSVDLIYGTEDGWITEDAVSLQRSRLDSTRVPYRVRSFPGGHTVSPEMVQALFGETDARRG